MTAKLFKEQLDGKYDGVIPATLHKVGGIAGGKNMRKVSFAGGWKARKGCSIHNSTAIAAASIQSLHQYTHPRLADYHFIAQCNGSLYDASGDPPAAGGTTFAAAALTDLAGTSKAGFSDVVRDYWFYADGDGAPVMWGGDGPYVEGFVYYDNSSATYVDFTRDVTDGSDGTLATITIDTSDLLYVASPCKAKGITFDLGSSVNNNAAAATVKGWRAGAWADVTATDGTATTGASLAKDGAMTWTAGADTLKVVNGKMAYWYQISFAAALDVVTINSVKLQFDPERITNKWSGVYETPLAVRYFDGTAEYVDYTGKLTNESSSQYLQLDAASTSAFLYVKSAEPLCGIGFGVIDGYEQTGAALIDHVEYWDGDSYTEVDVAIADDGTSDGSTKSLVQSGTVWWNAAGLTVKKRTFSWDSTPGYWYRVSWSATLDGTTDDLRIFMISCATFPDALPAYDGCVEFKGRLFTWGDPEYPNRMRYSAKGSPDCFSGSDSGWTDEFGDMTKVVCARRFYNELIVWKANSVWLLEGYSPITFGTLRVADTVGCCSPKTTIVVETGYPSVHTDEPLSVAIWADTDGIYVLDGRKPKKVSLPVDNYFNTEYSDAIAAASLDDLQAFQDKMNNEYHLLLNSTTELVYNYILDEWYPPWVRNVGAAASYLVTGLCLRGTDGRYYAYGGNTAGFVFRLENDTSDKSATNVDVVIEQRLKTRAISADQKMATTLEFIFRKAFIEAKARSAGTITTYFYKDLASAATTLSSPAAISLINTGYSLAVDGVETNQTNCNVFQLEFVANTADLELEIYSFLYQLEARGEFAS